MRKSRNTLPALAVALIFAAMPRLSAAEAPAPDPLLSAVPLKAAAVATLNLRPETESAKTLAAGQTPEQAAVARAVTMVALQQALLQWAPGVDVETALLPVLTRRAALCWLPAAGPKKSDTLLFIETGGPDAAAAIAKIAQAGVKAKRLEALPPVDGTPVWKGAANQKPTFLTYVGSLVVIGPSEELVADAIRQAKAAQAGGPQAPAAQAMAAAPAGILRIAADLKAQGRNKQGDLPLPGLTTLGLSARLAPAGLVSEQVLPLAGDTTTGPWAALANLKPTFTESVMGVPENAAAVVVAARPSLWFQAFNIPIIEAVAGGFIGPPALKGAAEAAGPILSDVMGQEVAIGFLPAGEKLGWLAVLTSARPDALRPSVQKLLQALQQTKGAACTATPIGAETAWSLKLPLRPDRPPASVSLAVSGARLLLASDPALLQASITTLGMPGRSVTSQQWYQDAMVQLGPNPILKAAGDARVLGRLLTQRAAAGGLPSQKYAARAIGALLPAFRTGAASIRVEGGALRGMAQMGVDYQKLAAIGGALPAGAVVALALGTAGKEGPTGAKAAAMQTACANSGKQLALAAIMYEQDQKRLPAAEGWVAALAPYYKERALLHCPADSPEHAASFAFNRNLAGRPLTQIANPAQTVLFYETTSAGDSPSGTGADLPDPPRHPGGFVVVFADGHVQVVKEIPPAWFQVGAPPAMPVP